MKLHIFQSGNDRVRMKTDYFVFHLYKSININYTLDYQGDGKYVTGKNGICLEELR